MECPQEAQEKTVELKASSHGFYLLAKDELIESHDEGRPVVDHGDDSTGVGCYQLIEWLYTPENDVRTEAELNKKTEAVFTPVEVTSDSSPENTSDKKMGETDSET